MVELVKIDFIEIPDIMIVGRKLGVDWVKVHESNPIPEFWEVCFKDDVFKTLEGFADFVYDPAYVGYMTMSSYTCGMMMKLGFPVPEGFDAEEIKPTEAAVGWVRGKEPDLFMEAHAATEKALEDWGYMYNGDAGWAMEVYNCPRFTEKDENGKVILDYYIPVVK